MSVPVSDLPANLVPKNDLPDSAPVSRQPYTVPADDLPTAVARPGIAPLPTAPPPTQFHPNSAIRVTPSPHVHAQNQAQEFFGKAAQGAQGALDIATGVEQAKMHAINDTLAGLDAALGAPGRALQGAIGAQDANPVHVIQNAIDNTIHPFDRAKVDHNLDMTMRHLGVSTLEQAIVDHVTGKKLQPFVHNTLAFGTNLIVDPTIAIPVVGELAKVARIAGHLQQAQAGFQAAVAGTKAAQAASKFIQPTLAAAQTAGKAVVKSGAKLFGRRPELDKHLDEIGKPARMGIENKITNNFVRPQQAKDEALLEQHKGAMAPQGQSAGVNVDPLKQRVLEEAFVYGNSTMRAQAMNLGYRQLTEKLHGKDYFKRQENTTPFGISKYDVHNRLDDLDNELRSPGADHYAVWKQALDQSRNKAFEGLVNRETRDFLANHGGIANFDWHNATQVQRDKQAKAVVDSLTFGPKKVELGGALGQVAKFTRGMGQNSVMLDPLPHGLRNVGMLAYLSGGPKAFGKGLGYALAGLKPEQLAKMSDLGLHADYISTIKGSAKLGSIGDLITAIGKGDSAVLNRLELGYRQALYEHYDSFLPKALPGHEIARDYRIADLIHRDLGDYRNISAFAAALQAIGGPFVAFRVGTVPSAVGRAIRARPGTVESIIKLQQGPLTDRDNNSEIALGGPVQDASKAYLNQVEYGANGSTSGPIGEVLGDEIDAHEGYAKNPIKQAEQAAIGSIPGASMGMNLVNVGAQELANATHGRYGSQDGAFHPYGESTIQGPHSMFQEMLLQAFGLHTQKIVSAKRMARDDKSALRAEQEGF